MIKKLITIIFISIIIITITVFTALFFKSISPYNYITAFAEGKVNTVIEGTAINTNDYPIIDEDKILIPVYILKNYIYSDVELSTEYDRLYVEFINPKFKLETEELDKRINKKININFLVEDINGVHYINIKGYEKLFGIKTSFVKNTNILIIDKIDSNSRIGILKNSTYLRPKKSLFSFNLDKLKENEKLRIFNYDGRWLKVRTSEGYIGYVLASKVDITDNNKINDSILNTVRDNWNKKDKINLVWDYIYKYSPDLSSEDKIEGLDVISPTWFSLTGESGYIVNNADINYVKQAHDKGYKVWALVNNSFDKDLTHKLLANKDAKENFINQLVIYSSIYNLDGINIDFENMYYEDRDRFTNFVEKLTEVLKQQNLIVSVDFTIPSTSLNWSKVFDRKRLSEIVDYCMVMTYDEHWASSPKSGSVASIDWVENGIEKTLKYVPKDKLLMGVPFYTREWEEENINGKIKIKSKALSMSDVEDRIQKYNLEVVWIEEEGQHYTEYINDNKMYKIWIEDADSIKLKTSLVNKYGLRGISSWRKGFETKDIWKAINSSLKK